MPTTRSREVRAAVEHSTDRQAQDYLPLVRATVGHVARRVPRHVERDDLMAAGMEGLAQALRSYDPERGGCFESFAGRRIRGAVLDELRRRDWAGRALRTRARRVTAATEALTARLGRAPSLDEVAIAAQLSRQDVADLVVHLDRASRLERRMALGSGDVDGIVDVADDAPGPDANVLETELKAALHGAVAALPDRLRWAVEGHFGDGREMKDLAAEMGVTPSRVSQLCAEAISLLRDGIAAQLDPRPVAPGRPDGPAGRRRATYVASVVQRSPRRRPVGGPMPTAA